MKWLSRDVPRLPVGASRRASAALLSSVVVVLAGLLVTAGASSGSAAGPIYQPLIEFWDGTAWTQQASPNPEGSTRLTAVAALSATDAWSFGEYGIPGTDGKALAEHWDGASWQQVPMPSPRGANEVQLNAVTAASAADVWVVGDWAGVGTHNNYAALTEHWDGSRWTIVPTPRIGYGRRLFGVAALSPTNVWAVGYYGTAQGGVEFAQLLVLHWNGVNWRRVATPQPRWASQSRLAGAAVVSPRSVWVAGTYTGTKKKSFGPSRTLTMHWNGKKWTQVPSPNSTGGNTLSAVATAGRNDLWATGGHGNGARGRPLAEHWNGHSWRIVPAHSGYPVSKSQALTSLAVVTSTDIWASGYHEDSLSLCDYGLVEHWDGAAWTPVRTVNPDADHFSAIGAASATVVWAVGDSAVGC